MAHASQRNQRGDFMAVWLPCARHWGLTPWGGCEGLSLPGGGYRFLTVAARWCSLVEAMPQHDNVMTMTDLTIDQLVLLRTLQGQTALEAAAKVQAVDPAAVTRLRGRFEPELVTAALRLADLRRRAGERFSRADGMYFAGADLLEQATSEPVAVHKAARYAGFALVADLCCGAGGDALAIAGAAGGAVGVDADPAAAWCLRENARAYGLADRVRAVVADIDQWVPQAEALHIDPPRRARDGGGTGAGGYGGRPQSGGGHEGRHPPGGGMGGGPASGAGRAEGGPAFAAGGTGGRPSPGRGRASRGRSRRQLSAEEWAPWIERVRLLSASRRHVGAKLSPAVDVDALDWADEVELISENGVLKQAVTWCGGLARSRRSAAVIRSTDGTSRSVETLASDRPVREPAGHLSIAAGRVLYEPDAAVVRAGLLGNLAERLDAGLVDPHLPLLAREGEPVGDPLVRAYRVVDVLDFSIKRLKQTVRSRRWKVAEVKTRAFAMQPEEILGALRQVALPADALPVTLWAVRLGAKPVLIATQRVVAGEE